MTESDSTQITSYHAHVYFDAATVDRARLICTDCAEHFGITMGRVHERAVGPHPDWSCQLSFGPDQAGDVIGWLALNRKGLAVLIHPMTGHALQDHTDHAIWMGAIRPLDTSVFDRSDATPSTQ